EEVEVLGSEGALGGGPDAAALSAVALARKELERDKSQLEEAKFELVQVLFQSVETARLEQHVQASKWFNAKALAQAREEVERKEALLKRVQKVLVRSGNFAKPVKGTTVVIQRNNFTVQVCPEMVDRAVAVAQADDDNSLYLVEGCNFWLRRLDFRLEGTRQDGADNVSVSSASSESSVSDSECSDDEDAAYTPVDSALLGCWVLDRCEGDMSDVMVDAGVDWITQRTAKSFNYGVGLVSHTLEQSGKKLTIEMKGGLKTLRTKIDMSSAGPSETQAEDGSEILVTGKWDGSALVIAGKAKGSGKVIQTTKRYLEGNELVQEIFPVSSKYSPAKRIFRLK
ncbi:unnamed protein product, partial [Prorocentrum cordatum]